MTRTDTGIQFTLDVEPDEVDQFYFAASQWRFFVDDGREPPTGPSDQYGYNSAHEIATWVLSATAVKGPD